MKRMADRRVPKRSQRFGWKVWIAALVVVAFTVAVPVAWASHLFGDVPDAQPFHSQISAIANAGITTGCGGGNYCPNDFVRRDAMAAFMHRGYTRVAEDSFFVTADQTSDVAAAAVGSLTITPGLPAGALAGANGFISAVANITIQTPAAGCPCTYRAVIRDITEGLGLNGFYVDVEVGNDSFGQMSVVGAIPVDVVGSHAIQIRVFRTAGTGNPFAYGTMTVTYHPFGSAGGDVLSTGSSASSAPDGLKTN